MKVSRGDRAELVREACAAPWVLSFLAGFQGKYKPADLLGAARQAVYLYLREKYSQILVDQGCPRAEAHALLHEMASDVVVLRHRHRSGPYAIAPKWTVSPAGDTYDGEYDLAAG